MRFKHFFFVFELPCSKFYLNLCHPITLYEFGNKIKFKTTLKLNLYNLVKFYGYRKVMMSWFYKFKTIKQLNGRKAILYKFLILKHIFILFFLGSIQKSKDDEYALILFVFILLFYCCWKNFIYIIPSRRINTFLWISLNKLFIL